MPFKITHGEQIKLISSFDWLDVDTLEDLGGEVREILNIDGSTIEIERSVAISEMFERRISPPPYQPLWIRIHRHRMIPEQIWSLE